ncbi:zinc-binding dehydrogenase [Streptomyces sp. NPDC004838]
MRAIYCDTFSPDDPLAALRIGERPEPTPQAGWSIVQVRAAALNGHDLWSLKGVGLTPSDLPRILGSDGAGVDDQGRRVVIYPLIPAVGADREFAIDAVAEPLLSERHDGTLAEKVTVPTSNLFEIPDSMTFEEAASLPTAWLTAYRMLFTSTRLRPGDTVLVQGAAGGVSTALVALGAAAGLRVWVTGRTEERRAIAKELGADAVFASNERLPERVDAVMETVGEPTWRHSVMSLKTGGVVVVAGATGGHLPTLDLRHVFFRQLRVIGSRMGTPAEFGRLLNFLERHRIRPRVGAVLPYTSAEKAFRLLDEGAVGGKVVITF